MTDTKKPPEEDLLAGTAKPAKADTTSIPAEAALREKILQIIDEKSVRAMRMIEDDTPFEEAVTDEILEAIKTSNAEAYRQGQIAAFNYALMKSQVFTYAYKVGEIRAGEQGSAVPRSVIQDRLAELERE